MSLKLFNSLTKQEENFESLEPGKVRMYTCGPTVYNYAHIGNFFAYLSADTLYRWLKYGEGYEVQWVMNITDIDDKTIRDSKQKHPDLEPMKALRAFCDFYAEAFMADLQALNITGVSAYPRPTECISDQQELVRKLYERGYAYIADGSVYFSIEAYKKDYQYGRLVHIDEGFQAGARVDQDEYEKANAADFVLWKGYKEGEPFWEFELDGQDLKGRPGWHLECSAMEEKILGLPFDIHTGGVDLKFPHHEDEIAQSCGGYGIDPTKYWMHNGHLLVEGRKMSKSLNNFFRLKDLLDQGWELEVIRLAMVTNHYRRDFNFTQNGLHAMKHHIVAIRDLYAELNDEEAFPNLYIEKSFIEYFNEKMPNWEASFRKAFQEDLNTAQAFSVFIECVRKVLRYKNSGTAVSEFATKEEKESFRKKALQFIDFVSNIFGVDFKPQAIEIPQEVVDLINQQKQAKADKDFAKADALRDQVKALGFSWDQRKDEIVKL